MSHRRNRTDLQSRAHRPWLGLQNLSSALHSLTSSLPSLGGCWAYLAAAPATSAECSSRALKLLNRFRLRHVCHRQLPLRLVQTFPLSFGICVGSADLVMTIGIAVHAQHQPLIHGGKHFMPLGHKVLRP